MLKSVFTLLFWATVSAASSPPLGLGPCPALIQKAGGGISGDVQTYLNIVRQLAQRGSLTSKNISDLIDSDLRKNPTLLPATNLTPAERHVLQGQFMRLLDSRSSWRKGESGRVKAELFRLLSEGEKRDRKRGEARENTSFVWAPFLIKKNFFDTKLGKTGGLLSELRPKSGGHYGQYIIKDRGIAVIDLETGKGKIIGGPDGNRTGTFYETHEGKVLAAINSGKSFSVFDVRTGDEIASIPLSSVGAFKGRWKDMLEGANLRVTQEPDGSLALIIFWEDSVESLNEIRSEGTKAMKMSLKGEMLSDPVKVPDGGEIFISASGKVSFWSARAGTGRISIFDFTKGKRIFDVPMPKEIEREVTVRSEFFQAKSGHRYITARGWKVVYLFDVDGPNPEKPLRYAIDNDLGQSFVDFYRISERRTVFLFSNNTSIKMIDLDSMGLTNVLSGKAGEIFPRSVFVKRDGRPMIVAQEGDSLVMSDLDRPDAPLKVDMSQFSRAPQDFIIRERPDGGMVTLIDMDNGQDLVQVYGPLPDKGKTP